MPKTAKLVAAPPELRYGELDLDRVVAAALELAEQKHSLEKVTMRALAAHLGISPAAMYYHVKDRGELLDVTTDSVLARVRTPAAGLPWDAQLRALFTETRRVMLPVTGIAGILQSRPVSPSGHRLRDTAINILRAAGFSPGETRAAHMALSTFVLGAVAIEQAVVPAVAIPKRGPNDLGVFRGRDFTTGLDLIISGLKYQKELA